MHFGYIFYIRESIYSESQRPAFSKGIGGKKQAA
jgi:hypothetical protein